MRLQKVADREWAAAREYAALLLRGGSLPPLASHNLPLAPGERALLRTVVTVGASSGWGEEHAAAVIATTERLVVSHRLRGWQSFWFTDLTRFEPDLSSSAGWALTLRWHGGGSLRLTGVGVPALAVHAGAMALPSGWMDLPSFQPLLEGLERSDHPGRAVVGASWASQDPTDPADLLGAVATAMTQFVTQPQPDWVEALRSHPDAEALLRHPDTAEALIGATGRLAAEVLSAHWPDRAPSSRRASRGARIEMFLPQTPAIRPRVQNAARSVFNRAVSARGAVCVHPELEGLRTDELWEVWSGALRWFQITVLRLSAQERGGGGCHYLS